MFSGLVEELAVVSDVTDISPGRRLTIKSTIAATDAQIGDSICVNGCCLTVVEINEQGLAFDAGPETLKRTNLGDFQIGTHVNLERSLALGDRLGGHLVTGHVDDLGVLDQREDQNEWSTFWFKVSANVARQMASKGSVAVDGVSLTLVDVEQDRFSVALIPHTLSVTTLGQKKVGDTVNIETDLLAKYVQRQLEFRSETA
ncbi:MAG: riboflavin synthase [Planctomycetales bacterium]|nr:riboflavin synthase [Planctomycetales bacterium]